MSDKEPTRLKDLLRLLDGLSDLQRDLGRTITVKLEAIRRADMQGLHNAMQQEFALTERLREREGLRKQLMDVIGTGLGLARDQGRALTISQLAVKLPEAARHELWLTAGKLRRAMASTAQANRVAAVSIRTLLQHVQWVFAAIRPAGAAPLTYSNQGKMVPPGGTVVLETVG